MNLLEILQGANVALHVLQARVILVICLLLTAGIYGWAMWLQTQLGAIIAAAWSVLVFLPLLYSAGGKSHGVENQAKHEHTEQADTVPARTTPRAA